MGHARNAVRFNVLSVEPNKYTSTPIKVTTKSEGVSSVWHSCEIIRTEGLQECDSMKGEDQGDRSNDIYNKKWHTFPLQYEAIKIFHKFIV